MPSNHINLFAPLPPIDSEAQYFPSIASLFGSNAIVGCVTDSTLRLRRRIRYGNSFQTIFVGRLQPQPGGTVISGTFRMRSDVRVFLTFWFTGAILGGGLIFISTVLDLLNNHRWNEDVLMGLLIPIALLVGGTAIVSFGRYLSRDDVRFLTDFLTHTLNAETSHPVGLKPI